MSQNLLKTFTFLKSNVLKTIQVNSSKRFFGIFKVPTQNNRFSNFKCKRSPILFPSIRKIQNIPLDVNTNVANNVILWKFEGTKYFKNLGIFGIFQFIVLSGFSYSVCHLIPSKKDDEDLWQYLKNALLSLTLVIVPILAAVGALGLIYFYTSRSLKTIILHRGGKNVTLVMFHPLHGSASKVVPVDDIIVKKNRSEIRRYMPLRIKSTRFFHLLDADGVFLNPDLFDHTIGHNKDDSKKKK